MYNYYNPYNFMQQPTPQPAAAQQQQASPIIWVQGESGAKSYLVAPGQSVLLMDSESQRFFIKSSDSAGIPLPLRVFNYTEQQTGEKPQQAAVTAEPLQFATLDDIKRLEAKITALEGSK